jgi:predicted ester cyclase
VAAHITIRGTHKGELMRIAPTGKHVQMRVSDIARVAVSKIVERWGIEDTR